ncbi:MAG TPA: hypothetical protein VIH78_02220 [Terriglobales bacterium]
MNTAFRVMLVSLLFLGTAALVKAQHAEITHNTWTNEAAMLVGVSEPSAGVVGTSMVVADGAENSGFTGYTEGFDIATNTWSALTPDPTSRSASCYGAVGPKLYVIGGTSGGEGAAALSLNESFQLSKDKWATLAPMPQGSVFPASTIYKGKLYSIGGCRLQSSATCRFISHSRRELLLADQILGEKK